jgi:phosphohistidine phosphatase
MDLYLLRHGIAEDQDFRFKHDSERPLTDEGRDKVKAIGRAMAVLGLTYDVILTSPFVRTLQTAEIIARQLDLEKCLVKCRHLAVGGDMSEVFSTLRTEHAEAESVLLVGHEPALSSLISMMVTGQGAYDITMKKGGLCCLSVSSFRYGRSACLEWLMTPKQLLAIAGG